MATQYTFQIFLFFLALCYGKTYLASSTASGKSTFYGGNPSGGACGYADVPTSTFPFGYYAACGGTTFDSGYGCGKCYEITCIGPEGDNPSCYCSTETPSVIISCMDQCPECSDTHFDLDPTAMARIVGDGLSGTCGIIETTVRRVSCEYTDNIKIRSKSGTSEYWYGFHIDDVARYGGISSVDLYNDSSGNNKLTTCNKAEGPSFWACSGGYPYSVPITLKLTDSNGNTLMLPECITNFNGGAEFDCGINYDSGATAAPAPPTTAAPTKMTTTSARCDGTNLMIRNHADSEKWWLALYVLHACETCGSITKVEIKDNTNYQSWYESTDSIRGSLLYYSFENNGNEFTAPISVRVTNSEGSVTITDAITDLLSSTNDADSGTNICESSQNTLMPSSSPTVSGSIECETGGCSGQICEIEGTGSTSTCEWLCEYGCLEYATCSETNGECQWLVSINKQSEYNSCMSDCGATTTTRTTSTKTTQSVANPSSASRSGLILNIVLGCIIIIWMWSLWN